MYQHVLKDGSFKPQNPETRVIYVWTASGSGTPAQWPSPGSRLGAEQESPHVTPTVPTRHTPTPALASFVTLQSQRHGAARPGHL